MARSLVETCELKGGEKSPMRMSSGSQSSHSFGAASHSFTKAREDPSSAHLPFFGRGFPHYNKLQKKGYPYSNLSTGEPIGNILANVGVPIDLSSATSSPGKSGRLGSLQ